MKWTHGYSAIFFSVLSLIPSVIARYSYNHLEEGNYIIVSCLSSIKEFFYVKVTEPVNLSMMATPWYNIEENLIILFQGISLFFTATSIMFVIFSVLIKEKSLFYATAVLISAYSIYFVNTKLSLVIIFLVFISILNLRKKIGINT